MLKALHFKIRKVVGELSDVSIGSVNIIREKNDKYFLSMNSSVIVWLISTVGCIITRVAAPNLKSTWLVCAQVKTICI